MSRTPDSRPATPRTPGSPDSRTSKISYADVVQGASPRAMAQALAKLAQAADMFPALQGTLSPIAGGQRDGTTTAPIPAPGHQLLTNVSRGSSLPGVPSHLRSHQIDAPLQEDQVKRKRSSLPSRTPPSSSERKRHAAAAAAAAAAAGSHSGSQRSTPSGKGSSVSSHHGTQGSRGGLPPPPYGQPGADRTATVGRVVPKGTPAGVQGTSAPTGIAAGVPRDPPVVKPPRKNCKPKVQQTAALQQQHQLGATSAGANPPAGQVPLPKVGTVPPAPQVQSSRRKHRQERQGALQQRVAPPVDLYGQGSQPPPHPATGSNPCYQAGTGLAPRL